jgi:hypothetical protein
MATDFAVQFFFYPVIFGVLVLCVLAWKFKPAPMSVGFSGLDLMRLVHGYLGIILATLIFAYIETYLTAVGKVELGHIEKEELLSWVPQWGIYMFVLFAPFVLALATFIGFPLFFLLSKFRFNSITGAIFIGLSFPVLLSFFTYIKPYNNWCSAHLSICLLETFSASVWPAILISVFFGMFAKLPLWRSEAANET